MIDQKINPLVRRKIEKPFIGLRSYDSNESILFFGRNKQIDELLGRLDQSRFLGIVGSSGCGKSSLIKAGLIPKLKGGFLTQERDAWQIAEMRPGNDPLLFFSESIIKAAVNNTTLTEADLHNKALSFKKEILKKGVQAVIEKLAGSISNNSDNNDSIEEKNFLLLVDQFEEIFRFQEMDLGGYSSPSNLGESSGNGIKTSSSVDEGILFVNIILALAEQKFLPAYVVITMRSDFIGDCNQFYGLPEMLNKGLYLVPRLNRQQRHEVIEGPIELFNATISNALLNRLLNDSDVGMDELPVLQHALMRTWNYWLNHSQDQNPLELMHYEAIGGIQNSINQHANEIFNSLNVKQKKIAEVVFKSLTAFNAEEKAIRHPLKFEDLVALCQTDNVTYEDVKVVIDHFNERECAFLMPQKGWISATTVIDISHESLMRQWDKLINWMKLEKESVRNFKWLSETVKLQELESKKNDSKNIFIRLYKTITTNRSYLRGMDLKRALDWKRQQKPTEVWVRKYSTDYKEVIKFISTSRKKRIYRLIWSIILFGPVILTILIYALLFMLSAGL